MNFTNGSSDKNQKNLEHRKKTVLFMKAPLDMHRRRWTRYIQDRFPTPLKAKDAKLNINQYKSLSYRRITLWLYRMTFYHRRCVFF